MNSPNSIDWTKRVRGEQKVPEGCDTNNLTPFVIAAYRGSFMIGDTRRYADIKSLYTPRCPNPDSDRIRFDEWFAVDSMTCSRGFSEDLAWFHSIIESPDPYEEIIVAALDHLIPIIKSMKQTNLDYECNKLVLPAFLEKLIYRRMLLWMFQTVGGFEDVAQFLKYQPGAKKQYPGLRTMLSRAGLTRPSAESPFTSDEVLDEEKKWLRGIVST